jgi:hypothetical protein
MSKNPGALGDAHVIGVDFGTLSGRAVVVRVRDGAELRSAVHPYGQVGRIAGTGPVPAGRKGLLA